MSFLSSTRFSSRVGVTAVSMVTAAALAVPLASADEAPDTGLPATTQPAGSIEDGRVVSSLVNTDWGTVIRVVADIAAGTVTIVTVAEIITLVADSEIGVSDIVDIVNGAVAGSSDGAESPEVEIPVEDTPADDTLADEIPADETPADETPADETPAEDVVVADAA